MNVLLNTLIKVESVTLSILLQVYSWIIIYTPALFGIYIHNVHFMYVIGFYSYP